VPLDGPRQVWRSGGPPPPPPRGNGWEQPGSPPPAVPPPPSGPPGGREPDSPPHRPATGGWGEPPRAPGSGPGRLLPLHPLTVGDVLDGAFRALRATFATAAIVILLVQGPYQLLTSLVFVQALPEASDPVVIERLFTEGTADVALASRALAYGGAVAIVGLLVQVIVGAALAWLALRTDRGEEVSAGAALRASFSCSGATLGGTVLVGLLGFGVALLASALVALLFAISTPLGVIALIVAVPAAVIAMAALFGAYLMVIPIAVAEQAGALTTFRRALWVVRGRFWRTVGVMLLLGLVIGAVSFGFSLALGFLSELAGSLSWIVDAVSATATSLVTTPVTIFVALLLYLDARVRLEGYDLEVRARGMGSL
jgi:hypothetical protein